MQNSHSGDSPYVQMNSGNKVYLDDLTHNKYSISDIAHSLANSCRYNGHSDIFYSVAQHSVHCSYFVSDKSLALEALMHDAAEAVLTDLPRPVKYFLDGVKEFDERITADIFKKYGLQYPLAECIHEVDNRMLATEARQIMKNSNIDEWGFIGTLPVYNIHMVSWRPEHAKQLFLDRYNFLIERRVMHEDELVDDVDKEFEVVSIL